MAKPQIADYAPYYEKYIAKVGASDVHDIIATYSQAIVDFYTGLPESKADYSYAPGKWTLKDLLQHVVDTERIMSYRLLRIARRDQTPLAPFDEDTYAANAGAANRTFDAIKEELIVVRKSTDLLIRSLTSEQLEATGIASNHNTTANAVVYIMYGHLLHHQQIVTEKYLQA